MEKVTTTELKELLDIVDRQMDIVWMDEDGVQSPGSYYAEVNQKTGKGKLVFHSVEMEEPWTYVQED